ncbi:cyclodeaminase/cyclohydrolase family protein [Treponema endosymbiont of Eucomonympha sp.]|uniref:cyclodeaminase/cyclohydrolase family protein n=1 Tax=Treponema endosymbiont of Eucomonympha sp. TaxID=1580831 RepID=UPI000784D890|nr:cyclodeaminase/cyclohydrolase family protein [Treponema endosymbiont of Eucomonympha sp.]
MKLAEKTCGDFIAALAGKSPVPGGGGASALVGAVGTALGNMVGSLTAGKKKYADVEADIVRLQRTADKLQIELLTLIDKDAEDFEPLAKAYGLPSGTDAEKAEKAEVMEKCLKNACAAPFEIMRKCCEGIACCEEFGAKGSRLALSDAGVGVAFCKAALQGASLNVFINTKAMTDRAYADKINAEAISLLAEYSARADKTFKSVAEQLRA